MTMTTTVTIKQSIVRVFVVRPMLIVSIPLLLLLLLLWPQHIMVGVHAGRSTEFLTPQMTLNNMVRDIKQSLEATYNMHNVSSVNSIDLREYVRASGVAQYRLPAIDLIGVHNYDNEKDKLLSSGIGATTIVLSRDKIAQLCGAQLQHIVEKLNTSAYIDTLANYTVMNMIDSWGKPEASFLHGNRFWLGNYDQCMQSYIDGQHAHYCVASLTWNNNRWPAATNNLPLERYNHIKAGVCVPYACDSLAIEAEHEKLLQIMLLIMGESYTRNMSIASVYCLPDEQSRLAQWSHNRLAVTLVLLTSVWLIVIAAATLCDIIMRMMVSTSEAAPGKRRPSQPRLVKCFSLCNAVRSLLPRHHRVMVASDSEHAAPVPQLADMRVLDGLKSFALLGVVGAHTWLLRPISFSSFDGVMYANTLVGRMLTSIVPALSVNLFFAITGLVTTYIVFKTRLRVISSATFWLLFGVHRYMRIIPVWLLAFAMMKCFKYTGSGPLWDYGTSNYTNVGHCEHESWLSVVLLGASLRSPQEHCFVVGWYLANDVLFALTITPIYCILLHKLPRVAYSLVPVSVALATGYQMVRLGSVDADLTAMTRADIQTTSMITLDLGFLYSSPIVRLPYLMIGLVFGHVLIVHEWFDNNNPPTIGPQLKEATNDRRYQRWATHIMTVINMFGTRLGACIVLAGVVCLPEIVRFIPSHFKSLDNNMTVIFFSCPMLYICSIVFVFIVPPILMHQYHLSHMMTWPIWTPVSRIALSVLVTHSAIVQHYYMSYTQFVQTPPFIMIQSTVYLILLSYAGGFIFYLLFEYPIKSINDAVMRLVVTKRARAASIAQPVVMSGGKQQATGSPEIGLQLNGANIDYTIGDQRLTTIDMRMLRPPASPEIYRLNLGSNMKRASLA